MTTFNPEALSARKQINSVCKSLSKFLHVKDGMYGSSISEPIHVFAKNSESDDLLSIRFWGKFDTKTCILRIGNVEERLYERVLSASKLLFDDIDELKVVIEKDFC